MMPGMPDGPYVEYDPRWPGVKEIKFGDDWRARYIAETELPADAPLSYGYALVLMDERGYVTRPKGNESAWFTVEGPIPAGQKADAWAKEAAKVQTGAVAGKVFVQGYLECRATSHNREFEAGAITIRPFLVVVAKKMGDIPEDSPHERRRLPINEYSREVRRQYAAFDEHVLAAIDRYLVMSRKGEL